MKNSNKKRVKMIALLIAAFFALGIVGIAVTQSQTGFAAPADKNSAIGYIDTRRAMQAHPDAAALQTTMQTEAASAEAEFNEKAKDLPEQEKQRYAAQLQQRLQQKQNELLNAIIVKIEASVEKVAKAKGLAVVMQKDMVIYGGVDITDDVIKDFTKK